MAKELPYFQFEPAQYMTGNIQFCSLEAQGMFANICCIYWQRSCQLSLEQIERKFNNQGLLNELLNEDIIKVKNGKITIGFLVEQYETITNSKLILSERGRKGGLAKKKQRVNNKLTKVELDTKHNIREDKIIQDEIIVKETKELIFPFHSNEFINMWNMLIESKKWKSKTINALQMSLKKLSKHNEPTAIKMIEDCIAGDWQGFVEPKNVQTERPSKTLQNIDITNSLLKKLTHD